MAPIPKKEAAAPAAGETLAEEIVAQLEALSIRVDELHALVHKADEAQSAKNNELEGRLAELSATPAVAADTGQTPDTDRLDQLEARVKELGATGGDTLGDALALAKHAVDVCRAIANGVERAVGVNLSATLPPAPGQLASTNQLETIGAEKAS